MPERSGIELFAEDQFSKVFGAYERGLRKVERQAATAARTISKHGKEIAASWGTGVEDMTSQLDAMDAEIGRARSQLQGFADVVEGGETALGGLAGTLSLAGGVVAAVTAALTTLGAVGLAIWSRMKDAALAYVDANRDVQEAQERLNEEWTEAGEQLGQAIIPLKTELLNLEFEIARVLNERTIPAFKGLAGIAYSTFAGIVAGFKEIGQIGKEVAQGQVPSFEESWERIKEAGRQAFVETGRSILDTYSGARQVVEETEDDLVPKPDWSGLADTVNSALSSIRQAQADHLRQMQRQEEDAARKRARAWRDYEKQVSKTIKSGEKKLAKLTADYEEDRAETIIDYQERIAEAEEETYRDRAKAQEEFERKARQARERFQLNQLQSERRYQFERNQLVAEGDTLAIEQLDERFKLEQKEAQENESLRERQERENAAAQIRETGEAAREQLRELEQQLHEQLAEQEANYREQIEQQRQANAERLAEMAADFQERQRLEDENMAIQQRRREEDYRRQLESLGANLADQLRRYEDCGLDVAALAQRYYGTGGPIDSVLEGFHAREEARIDATAFRMAALFQRLTAPTTPEIAPPLGGYSTGYGIGLQHGGVVTGPASFHVEAGLREAVIPLGGTMQHNFSPLNVNIHGLAGAAQSDVNAIASALAREMTNQVRGLRRS